MADDYLIVETLGYLVFLLCFSVATYFRERARKLKKPTGKLIRSIYRKAWVEDALRRDQPTQFIDTIRNNIMISTTLISAIIISFGFVLNADVIRVDGNLIDLIRLITIITLIAYAFFMMILEVRTLTYIPIVFQTPETLIKKYDKMDKASYIAKLLHESFDNFSNATRALFYIAPLIIWFYNVHLFIIATLVLTYIMYNEDFGRESGITIF